MSTQTGGPRGWQAGQSGNPAMVANPARFQPGHTNSTVRPVGLMRYIRHVTGDGKDMADFMLAVMKGDVLALTPEWLAQFIAEYASKVPAYDRGRRKGAAHQGKVKRTGGRAQNSHTEPVEMAENLLALKLATHPKSRQIVAPTLHERIYAARWLADRGFGRAVISIEHLQGGGANAHAAFDFSRLSAVDRETVRRLIVKARRPEALPEAGAAAADAAPTDSTEA